MKALPVALAVLLAGCAAKNSGGVKVDVSIETMIPPTARLLAGTRLESLLQTPIYQKNFADRPLPQVEEFARRTGIDPRKDLWQLLYVSDGQQGMLLARGKFADEMMEPNFEKQGTPRSSYKGFNFYGNGRDSVVLFSPTVAAAGENSALQFYIDHRGEASGPPPAMSALMKEIPAEAQFWAAYSGGPMQLPFDASGVLGNMNKLVSSIQSGTVYFDLRQGVDGVARADCANDASAEQVAGALRALIGIGRLSVPPNHPELAQVYDTLRVTQESRRVNLYIKVPQAMADQFLALWLRRP